MPPHLHPRSTATSTLFAGTLLASFVVVGIPHLFPCPRPRRGYADSERQPQQRIPNPEEPTPSTPTNKNSPPTQDSHSNLTLQRKTLSQRKAISEEAALFAELQREADALEKEARECPVPKPRGFIGRFLGFEEDHTGTSGGSSALSAASLRPTPAPSIASQAGDGNSEGGSGRG